MDADGRAATVPVTGASTEASGASRGSRPDRRRDLDRLRILACFSTFCYHAVQVFDLNPYYHLKSNTLSPGIDVAARLLHAVRMPLFFLIAGMVAVPTMCNVVGAWGPVCTWTVSPRCLCS